MNKPLKTRFTTRRALQIVAAALVVAGLMWYMRPRPIPVAMGKPQRTTVREYISEEAKTRLATEYILAAPVAGTVQRIALEPGDLVEAGQVIAQVDPFPLEQQAKALEAQIAQTKAQILGVDKTKPKPEDIEGAKVRARSLSDEAQGALRARDEAQIALDDADRNFKRTQGLFDQGVISQNERDMAEARRDAAAASFARANAGASAAQKGVRVGDLEAQRVAGSIDDNEYMRQVYTAAAEALQAQLDAVKSDLEKTQLRAPVSGPVLEKYLPDARSVLPGTPLMKLGDPATLEIESDVLSEEVGRIKSGARVELLGRAFGVEPRKDGAPNMGTVKRIYPAAFMKISALGVEQQRVKVLIDLDRAADGNVPAIRPGTRLDVHIITGEKQNALAVPERAAFRRHGQWYVFKVESDKAKITPVTLGLKNDTLAEITEGIGEGDTLVTEPMNELTDGAVVTQRETAE